MVTCQRPDSATCPRSKLVLPVQVRCGADEQGADPECPREADEGGRQRPARQGG